LRKLLATAAALLVLAALGIAVGSLGWRPGTRAGPSRVERVATGAGELSAGVAELPIDLPGGVPIAGFPRLRWASDGVRDPVHVRALVLGAPGVKVALVSAELLLVPAPLTRAVEARVKDLGLDHVVLGATHTHAGPGGYWKDPLAENVALGPYDERFAAALAARIAEAIRAAAGSAGPVTLEVARDRAERLARSRTDGEVDARLVSLRLARPGGKALAEVVIFPAHPTLLGSSNARISGDWPGIVARSRAAPMLFFQGALGDQSARPPPKSTEQLERYARRISYALDHLHFTDPDPAPALALATATAVLPPPDLGASPPFLRRLTKNLLYGLFPDRGTVAALRIGPLILLAMPCEPVAEVGRRWRERAGEAAEIVSLANEYLGYVETPERMSEGEGETHRTYFGPELESRLGDALDLAAEQVEKAGSAAQNRTAGMPASVQVR
jgi:hypothetical protein